MSKSFLFTSESVTEGHPDKVCDQISDAILDAVLTQDPEGHVAAECAASTGLLVVLGEISTSAILNIQEIARRVIADIGYLGAGGFDANSCAILTAVNRQSPEIAAGIAKTLEMRTESCNDVIDEVGAGDQGMMFGFACDETPELMPMPIAVAHRMARRLAHVRKTKTLPYLRPDGKTQVTIEYVNQKPVRIDSIVISTQHDPVIDSLEDNDSIQQKIAADLKAYVVAPAFAELTIKPDDRTRYLINPSGKFVTGGPHADAGLTGRKIIVDTYGGYARHGGGAFSGKDPTKVDRSAAYAARHVAKNIVAAKLASRCEVQVSYAIGVARPLAINVTTFGTGTMSDAELTDLVKAKFDLRPAAIIANFDLKNLPAKNKGRFYELVAAYGHFGRPDLNLPWEALDRVAELKAALSKAVSA